MTAVDRPDSPLAAVVRNLGDRLIAAQRSIRVLDAVNWGQDVERAFLAARGRELPKVTRETYEARALLFEPATKDAELAALERDVRRRLGCRDLVGRMLLDRIRSYRGAAAMLAVRGTSEFSVRSRELYDGATRSEVKSIPRMLSKLCARLPAGLERVQTVNARCAGEHLSRRLSGTMAATIRIKLDDELLADAAAGCDYIKLRRRATFTLQDLALLEAHEGWAHLGTTLNGLRQPACRFLAKGPPMTAGLQEGLAVLCELLAGAAHADRVNRIWNRFEAVQMAQRGADFLDIYRFFHDCGATRPEAYHQAVRIFRGSLPAGCGPFAKDACYAFGLVRLLRLIGGRALPTPAWLFCGKFALSECENLRVVPNGLLAEPAFVPPPFRDPKTLGLLVTALFDAPVLAASLRFDETHPPPLVPGPRSPLSFPMPHAHNARSA